MRPLRAMLLEFEAHIGPGAPDANPYRILHANDIVNIITNPVNLNVLFDRLPLAVTYSSELVLEATMLEISVTPLSPSQLMINAGQSTSKMTVLNTFAGINERPAMDAAMRMFVASLICPGSVIFSINLDDLPTDDIYLRATAALASKLLFSYNVVARWSSLTEASVRTTEAAIVRCGIAAGVVEPILGVIGGAFLLDNVAPVPRAMLDGFDMLRTDDDGLGWRESGGMRYGAAPEQSPYVECQNRQLYVTHLDNMEGLDEEQINMEYALWNTYIDL